MRGLDWWEATMADKAWNKRQGQLIADKISTLFKNTSETRYWISINYFQQDNAYNIFFNIHRKKRFQRSIPIASYSGIKFNTLVQILVEVRNKYQFTFKYTNFTKEQCRELYRKVR